MIRFFERLYPSANAVLLEGDRPILVDTGFGRDMDDLAAWLGPVRPALLVNTHLHSDHAGANAALAARLGAPIAAGEREAAETDRGSAAWLRQEIASFEVARGLREGDILDTGQAQWRVLATPGHTAGHLSLFEPRERVVVLGDALHGADVGWLDPRRPEALDETGATLERIAGLGARTGFSGHGPALTDVDSALARGRRRVASWRRDPEQAGWHACKRVFAHALMLEDGLAEPGIAPFLQSCPWFVDHARLVFACAPAELVGSLLEAMLRADAAFWDGSVLRARAAYRRR